MVPGRQQQQGCHGRTGTKTAILVSSVRVKRAAADARDHSRKDLIVGVVHPSAATLSCRPPLVDLALDREGPPHHEPLPLSCSGQLAQ